MGENSSALYFIDGFEQHVSELVTRLRFNCFLFLIALCLTAVTSCASEPRPTRNNDQRIDRNQIDAAWRQAALTHRIDPIYSLSRDGRVLGALIVGSPRNSIYIKNLVAGNITQLALSDSDGVLLDPDISDDSTKLALVRSSIEAPYIFKSDIIITDVFGKVLDRIGSCNGLYRKPKFSPDGTKITYFKYANNGVPGDVPRDRGGFRSTVWLPYEFDLVSREEKLLVELAWRAVDWIEYLGDGSKFSLKASDVQFANDSVDASGVPFRRWRGMGGVSALDNLTDNNRRDLLWAQVVDLDPGASDPNDRIRVGYSSRSEMSVLGSSGVTYLASRKSPDDASLIELVLLDQQFRLSRVLSKNTAYVHAAAVSRDSCVVLDGRRPRNSGDVVVHVSNICKGTHLSFYEQELKTSVLNIIEGGANNDC